MATITDTWDATFQGLPNNARSADYLASDISTPKRAVSERGRREHYWTPGSDNSKHGLHLPGSAVAFVQDAAPTTRPDGDTLDDDDIGRLWFDSDDLNIPYLRLSGAWQQIGGGMTGTIYALGSGSADRSIQFAGDATLLWDESGDEFVLDKDLSLTTNGIIAGSFSGPFYNGRLHTTSAGTTTQNIIFDALSALIPDNDDSLIISGAARYSSGTTHRMHIFSRAVRYDTNTIYLSGLSWRSVAGSITMLTGTLTCVNGSSDDPVDSASNEYDSLSIAW